MKVNIDLVLLEGDLLNTERFCMIDTHSIPLFVANQGEIGTDLISRLTA